MFAFVLFSALTLVAAQDYLQDVPGGMTAVEMREAMLDEINKLRRAVHHGPPSNMNHVYWNLEIEKKAMEWARNCPGDHGGYIGSSGQNMHWFGWPPTEDKLRRCIYDFWKECISPGYDYWQARSVTGNWADTGHYTIQDGAYVLKVGCGFVNCNGKASTLVCNYDAMPGPSRLGDFVEKKYLLSNGTSRLYEVGPPCTGCRSGTGWCYKGLCVDSCPAGSSSTDCVCGLQDQCVHGTLDQETCQCQCKNDYTGHLCDRPCQNFGSNCNADSCNDVTKARIECAAYCTKCQCSDQGMCVNGAYDASSEVCGCVCTGGWAGKHCDTCTKETCQQGGTWNDETCSCDCPDPYRGKTCQLDCSVGDPNTWPCTRLEDSGAYVCSNGWYRNQCHARCYPECSAYYLKKCSNLKKIPVCKGGTFNPETCQCDCNKGWQGDLCDTPKCEDSTLPTAWPCSSEGESDVYSCSNGWFSGQCMYNCNSVCKDAYLNECSGQATDIPDCVRGEFVQSTCKCSCPEGWTGDLCDTPTCSGVVGDYPDCSHGEYDYTACQCVCEDGWTGDFCDKVICSSGKLPTEWPCSSYKSTSVYQCSNGWYRGQCWYNCDADCKAEYLQACTGMDDIPTCQHGTFDNQECRCICKKGWQGTLCDEPKCEESTLPSNWPCSSEGESDVYSCGNGWFRDQCMYNCNSVCKDSLQKECDDEEKCVRGEFIKSSCECNCPEGWTGDLCDTPTCPGVVGDYPECSHGQYDYTGCKCVCDKGWSGDQCDQSSCSGSKSPTSWPCRAYKYKQQYQCSNKWFSKKCLYHCNEDCKAVYLEACDGIDDVPACNHGQFDNKKCQCSCKKGWKGTNCDEPNCNVSKMPDKWPCTKWKRESSTKAFTCRSDWFYRKCLYNCNSECKANYLENCSGLDEIPECEDGKKFSPTACLCE